MRIEVFKRYSALAAIIGAGLLLSGCMRPSADAGMSAVSQVAVRDLHKDVVKIASPADEELVATRVNALLKRGLTPDRAVQVALLNNRGLQAAFNDLGITEAQLVQTALPPNPTISVARIAGGGELEIERQILVNLLALLTQSRREDIARVRIEEAKLRAAEKVLRLAADTRRAWYQAVSSRHRVTFLQSAATNAHTVSQLFKKLGETGAVNKLDQAREHLFHAEITAQLGKARLDHGADRERLVRLMGLWGRDIRFALPASLPRLPRAARARQNIEREAVGGNIRIAAARAELESTARMHGLVHATRYINLLEVRGISIDSRTRTVNPVSGDVEKEKARRGGLELEFQIPLFDFGQARQREAEESYMRAVNRLLEAAVTVRSQARESYQRYRGSYTLARHYDRYVLPLRAIISQESLLRYNAMIVDIIPVLAEARQRISSNIMAINARRDFWLADASLRAAIVGGLIETSGSGDDAPAIAASGGAGH